MENEQQPGATPMTPTETSVNESSPVTYTQDEVDILVNLAEQQGYLRCRNEIAAHELEKPALGDTLHPEPADNQVAESETLILNRSRRSVWNL